MARLQRVFIDTSELYPFTTMDVLLTLPCDLAARMGQATTPEFAGRIRRRLNCEEATTP